MYKHYGCYTKWPTQRSTRSPTTGQRAGWAYFRLSTAFQKRSWENLYFWGLQRGFMHQKSALIPARKNPYIQALWMLHKMTSTTVEKKSYHCSKGKVRRIWLLKAFQNKPGKSLSFWALQQGFLYQKSAVIPACKNQFRKWRRQRSKEKSNNRSEGRMSVFWDVNGCTEEILRECTVLSPPARVAHQRSALIPACKYPYVQTVWMIHKMTSTAVEKTSNNRPTGWVSVFWDVNGFPEEMMRKSILLSPPAMFLVPTISLNSCW